MSIIKMYLSVSAATAASASIDVPASGSIRAITMGMQMTDASPVSAEGAFFELSFLSGATFTTNDARGSLCQVSRRAFFVDAAREAVEGSGFCVVTPIDVKVAAGERIFLHGLPEGSVVAACVVYIYVDDGIDVGRAQIRRR